MNARHAEPSRFARRSDFNLKRRKKPFIGALRKLKFAYFVDVFKHLQGE